jgi:hypothetical protein
LCGRGAEANFVAFTRTYWSSSNKLSKLKGVRYKIEQIIQEKGEITHNELCKLNENMPSRSLSSAIKWLVRHSIINEKEKPLYAKLVKACKCGRTKIVFQSMIYG